MFVRVCVWIHIYSETLLQDGGVFIWRLSWAQQSRGNRGVTGAGEGRRTAALPQASCPEPAVLAQRGCLGGPQQRPPATAKTGQVQISPLLPLPWRNPGAAGASQGARKAWGRRPAGPGTQGQGRADAFLFPAEQVAPARGPPGLEEGSLTSSLSLCSLGWNVLLEASLHVLGVEFPRRQPQRK